MESGGLGVPSSPLLLADSSGCVMDNGWVTGKTTSGTCGSCGWLQIEVIFMSIILGTAIRIVSTS